MDELLTCAKCGQLSKVCNSAISDGIKQPRMCMECLKLAMHTGDWETLDVYWLRQLAETGDKASFTKVLDGFEDLDPTMRAKLEASYKVWSKK